jgi:hypothetical protein
MVRGESQLWEYPDGTPRQSAPRDHPAEAAAFGIPWPESACMIALLENPRVWACGDAGFVCGKAAGCAPDRRLRVVSILTQVC